MTDGGLDFTVSSRAMAPKTTAGSMESSATDAPSRRIVMGTMRMPSRPLVSQRGTRWNRSATTCDPRRLPPSRAVVPTRTSLGGSRRDLHPAGSGGAYPGSGHDNPPLPTARIAPATGSRGAEPIRLRRPPRPGAAADPPAAGAPPAGPRDHRADPAATPRPGRAGVPGAHVGERDRHRRGRHHDPGPGPDRRRQRAVHSRPTGSRT